MSWPRRIEAECIIKGCSKPFKARGLCDAHYRRWRVNGDPYTLKRAPDGQGCLEPSGYVQFRAENGGKGKRGHVLAAERALGKTLPIGSRVHHVNGVKHDNRPSNLVICPSEAYHRLIHKRQDAMNACGNAEWLKCPFCKKYDAPENLYLSKDGRQHRHRHCQNEYSRRGRVVY